MAKRATWSVLGGESLLGRELRDLVGTAAQPVELKLISPDDEEAGRLVNLAGEPGVVNGLSDVSIQSSDLVFLAASPETARKAIELGAETALIDLTHGTEDHPRARLRAPMAEQGHSGEFGGLPPDTIHVIAHPAAIALAVFLERLAAHFEIRRAVANIFEPASQHGLAGIDELQQQTVNLLSFKSLPKKVFDAQLGFTMLARYGEAAPAALEETEARVERHLATLLRGIVPMPSLRVIQAPVFHGHSISIWVEFKDRNPGVEALERALAAAGMDVRGAGLDPPDNVGMAGQSGIAIGAVSVDRNDPRAAWFWIAADNLWLAAANAIAVARELS